MSGNPKRLHQRYPCRISVGVVLIGVRNRDATAELLDIGQGGGMLALRVPLPSPAIEVTIPYDGGGERFKARIVRTIGKDPKDARITHYGFSWELHLGNEIHLRRILDLVRAGKLGGSAGGGSLKRDYWSL